MDNLSSDILRNNKSYTVRKEKLLKKILYAGLIALFLGGVYNSIAGYASITVIVHFVGLALILTMLLFYKKLSKALITLVVFTYFCFVYTPIIWIALGGIYSSITFVINVFFLLAYYLLDGKTRTVLVSAFSAEILLLILFGFINPPATALKETELFPMALSFAVMLGLLIFISFTFRQQLDLFLVINHQDAIIDRLTGLYNNRFLCEALTAHEKEYEAQSRNDYTIAILDLDDFKKINDTYGHSVGDDVLEELGQLFRDFFPEDLVGRYGGDEFIVIFNGGNVQQHRHKCQKFIEAAKNKPLSEKSIPITLSAGVCPRSSIENSNIFIEADRLLYEAKRLGKSRVVV